MTAETSAASDPEGEVFMPVRTDPLVLAADEVTSLFADLLTDIEAMREVVERLFAHAPVDAVEVQDAVEPHARALLDRGTALGAGFVAARDALGDRSLYLAWWQGEDQQLLGESEAPATGAPFDYTRREWFRVPEQTRRRHVTGPYVDYVCTDEYVVTTTVPVVAAGRLVGVVGADVLVETLEDRLLATMAAADATLVGDHGRSMVSADHRLAPGTLVDPAAVRVRVECGDLPLALVRTD
jgi:hypothetical protein